MRIYYSILMLAVSFLLGACVSCRKEPGQNYVFPEDKPVVPPSQKPCFIWIDAAANFPDFANSVANIERDLRKAAECGFTHVIVDVRPTNGDVLFKTSHCDQVSWLGAWVSGQYTKVERTADFDYLQAFIDKGHALGLKVYAGFNTFVAGRSTSLGQAGVAYRNPAMAPLVTSLNTAGGIKSALDAGSDEIFFNPVHPEVHEYLISLLKDLAAYGKTGLDGIILDRGRFMGYKSDFSDYTRKAFEKYVGQTMSRWPEDVLPAGFDGTVPSPVPAYFKKWLEFRVKSIHDFMEKARASVKSVDKDVDFGAYVGGWYGSYYPVGVNWASPEFDTSAHYPAWASPKYKDYGYADLMDVLVIGAYASPGRVYGSTEWTMEGFCRLAAEKTRGDCGLLVGGPDVGNWDSGNSFSAEQENQAIVNSVKACADQCGGYFLFDMIHLKMADQWQYAAAGIELLKK